MYLPSAVMSRSWNGRFGKSKWSSIMTASSTISTDEKPRSATRRVFNPISLSKPSQSDGMSSSIMTMSRRITFRPSLFLISVCCICRS